MTYDHQTISRLGVYGVAINNSKILLVIQANGPYASCFDFPGGKIEFGETIEAALHREFVEETGMDFASMTQIKNLTAQIEVPSKNGASPYTFHHIGLIYAVTGLFFASKQQGELKYNWVDICTLKRENVSPFVWDIVIAMS